MGPRGNDKVLRDQGLSGRQIRRHGAGYQLVYEVSLCSNTHLFCRGIMDSQRGTELIHAVILAAMDHVNGDFFFFYPSHSRFRFSAVGGTKWKKSDIKHVLFFLFSQPTHWHIMDTKAWHISVKKVPVCVWFFCSESSIKPPKSNLKVDGTLPNFSSNFIQSNSISFACFRQMLLLSSENELTGKAAWQR